MCSVQASDKLQHQLIFKVRARVELTFPMCLLSNGNNKMQQRKFCNQSTQLIDNEIIRTKQNEEHRKATKSPLLSIKLHSTAIFVLHNLLPLHEMNTLALF